MWLRILLTRFRMSAHPLRIEVGRYHRPNPTGSVKCVISILWKMNYIFFFTVSYIGYKIKASGIMQDLPPVLSTPVTPRSVYMATKNLQNLVITSSFCNTSNSCQSKTTTIVMQHLTYYADILTYGPPWPFCL